MRSLYQLLSQVTIPGTGVNSYLIGTSSCMGSMREVRAYIRSHAVICAILKSNCLASRWAGAFALSIPLKREVVINPYVYMKQRLYQDLQFKPMEQAR